MRIALGSDHAGFPLKEHLIAHLDPAEYTILDFGTHTEDPVDYPDFAEAVARAVADGRADRGIVVCGSGAGACIASNKVTGVRAMVAHDTYTAHQGVEHDDANVLCLGARVVGQNVAEELASTFLGARFTGEERHLRRLNKVLAIEGTPPRTE